MLRVAGAYVVVAWGLMQGGEIVFPAFELPNRALRVLILALVAGLPITIVLAWLLEVTTRGIRFTAAASEPDGDTGSSHASEEYAERAGEDGEEAGRSIEMGLLGFGLPTLAAAVIFGLFLLGETESTPGATIESSQPASNAIPTLAVLPLEDLSAHDRSDRFFADGIHEDILTQLGRNRDLRLISRTSVMPYANSTLQLGELGAELGADHVLLGSVRRTEERVRVSVQLVRVATDEHVWADRFDSDLRDILRVQSEISAAIADALALELGGSSDSAIPRRHVVDPTAYDAFLEARDIHRSLDASDYPAIQRAQALYEEARRRDPDFPDAWLYLGRLHAEIVWFGFDRSDDRRERARRCLDHAKELGIEIERISLAEGIFAYYVDSHFGKALLYFDAAIEAAPGRSDAHFYKAMILRRSGAIADALESQRTALALDPLNLAHQEEFAQTLAMAGRLEEARDALDAVLARDAARGRARLQHWQLSLELSGDSGAVLDEMLAPSPVERGRAYDALLSVVAILAGRANEAFERLDPGASMEFERDPTHALLLAALSRAAGRSAAAEQWLSRARTLWSTAFADDRALESRIALVEGRFDRALELRLALARETPIDDDLIAGGPLLWDLMEAQLRAGEARAAAETLERLASRVALGSIPFGGFYVLEHWPDFAASRNDPSFVAALAALRPAYAAEWP